MVDELNGRIGIIRISLATLMTSSLEKLEEISKKFIVVRAERLFVDDVIEYTAVSTLFRKIKEGEEPPRYEVILTESEENVSVEVKEIA